MKLANYAVSINNTKGRKYEIEGTSGRNPWERDKARILHSSAFRRLQYKTQVFENNEGDNFRTRLTHSLEVAQIAVTISKALNLNESLAETLALAHDLGHAPFGHTGQDVLNELMEGHGGFEHNFNTLRIGYELESPYIEHKGLNLTYETLEGMLKHCSDKKAKELVASEDNFLVDIGKRFLLRKSPTLEAQVVDWADAIAYLHADMEDAINMSILEPKDMSRLSNKFEEYWNKTKTSNKSLPPKDHRIIHQTIREMMSDSITDLITTSATLIRNCKIKTLEDVRNQPELIQFSSHEKNEHLQLKRASRKLIYEHPEIILTHEIQAEKIKRIFQSLEINNDLIPCLNKDKSENIYLDICDTIARLTDRGVDRFLETINNVQINKSNKVIKLKM